MFLYSKTMKSTKELKPGVKYRGYGYLNEYGEFQFVPSEVGSRQGQRKLIKGEENFTVYTTDKLIIFHCCMDRKLSFFERIKKAMELLNELINILRNYEI